MELINGAFNDATLKETGTEIQFYYNVEHTWQSRIRLETFESDHIALTPLFPLLICEQGNGF